MVESKYRLYCETEGDYRYVWADVEPTTCPSGALHTIDTTTISIVDEPTIEEELYLEDRVSSEIRAVSVVKGAVVLTDPEEQEDRTMYPPAISTSFGYGLVGYNNIYYARGYIIFPGTAQVGDPVSVKALSKAYPYAGSIGGGCIRIYDATNQKEICEVSGIIGDTPHLVDLGELSNLSTQAAVWELQLKSVVTSGTYFYNYCYALNIDF